MSGDVVRVVSPTKPESRVPRYRGIADLVANLELADGRAVSLSVETKVNSGANRAQLLNTTGPPNHGVFLALGITAFFLTQGDLGADLNSWLVVGPAMWSELLSEQDVQSDAVLEPYVAQVGREADEHARARRLATESHGPPWRLTTSRRSDGLLEHYAWLAGIRERLDDPPACGPILARQVRSWACCERTFRISQAMKPI